MYIKTCPICGKQFTTSYPFQKYCSTGCSDKAHYLQNRKYYKENCEHKKLQTKHYRERKRQLNSNKALDQWIEQARQCNMSYGKYRAAIEQLGLTFEQLKAK